MDPNYSGPGLPWARMVLTDLSPVEAPQQELAVQRQLADIFIRQDYEPLDPVPGSSALPFS